MLTDTLVMVNTKAQPFHFPSIVGLSHLVREMLKHGAGAGALYHILLPGLQVGKIGSGRRW